MGALLYDLATTSIKKINRPKDLKKSLLGLNHNYGADNRNNVFSI